MIVLGIFNNTLAQNIYVKFVIVQVNIPELVLNKLLKDITAHLHIYLLAREKGNRNVLHCDICI